MFLVLVSWGWALPILSNLFPQDLVFICCCYYLMRWLCISLTFLWVQCYYCSTIVFAYCCSFNFRISWDILIVVEFPSFGILQWICRVDPSKVHDCASVLFSCLTRSQACHMQELSFIVWECILFLANNINKRASFLDMLVFLLLMKSSFKSEH